MGIRCGPEYRERGPGRQDEIQLHVAHTHRPTVQPVSRHVGGPSEDTTTTTIYYTLVFENSMLADDAAREKDIQNRRTRFTKMLQNMKILAEGGTLPPGAVQGPAAPTARQLLTVAKMRLQVSASKRRGRKFGAETL